MFFGSTGSVTRSVSQRYGSGSVPKCHESATLVFPNLFCLLMKGSGSVQIIPVPEHRYKDDLSSTLIISVQEG
jgi:hypothetical protein